LVLLVSVGRVSMSSCSFYLVSVTEMVKDSTQEMYKPVIG